MGYRPTSVNPFHHEMVVSKATSMRDITKTRQTKKTINMRNNNNNLLIIIIISEILFVFIGSLYFWRCIYS